MHRIARNVSGFIAAVGRIKPYGVVLIDETNLLFIFMKTIGFLIAESGENSQLINGLL